MFKASGFWLNVEYLGPRVLGLGSRVSSSWLVFFQFELLLVLCLRHCISRRLCD